MLGSDLHSRHVFSRSNQGADLFKHWRITHILDICLAILISVSNLLRH